MDPLWLLKGFIIMISMAHVISQRFSAQYPLKQLSLLDDDYSNRDMNLFNPFQRAKQKFVKKSGNVAAPTEITFDTYNAAFPELLERLGPENIYWRELQQQLQQEYANLLRQQQSKLLKTVEYQNAKSSIAAPMKQQRRATCKQNSGNGNRFDDMLFSNVNDANAATTIDDDAKEDQNINESSATATQLSNVGSQYEHQYTENGGTDYIVRTAERPEDGAFLQSWSTERKRISPPMRLTGRQSSQDVKNQENNVSKETRYPLALLMQSSEEQIPMDDVSLKHNAFRNYKREKSRPQLTRFLPSISAGAMTNLGHFFKDLKNNVHFMENRRLTPGEEKLLDGDHPINMLHEELMRSNDGKPTSGTAAFLHAIRTYRPSQKIRSLVSLNPEGYHGSQFLDPNYMWVGLGK